MMEKITARFDRIITTAEKQVRSSHDQTTINAVIRKLALGQRIFTKFTKLWFSSDDDLRRENSNERIELSISEDYPFEFKGDLLERKLPKGVTPETLFETNQSVLSPEESDFSFKEARFAAAIRIPPQEARRRLDLARGIAEGVIDSMKNPVYKSAKQIDLKARSILIEVKRRRGYLLQRGYFDGEIIHGNVERDSPFSYDGLFNQAFIGVGFDLRFEDEATTNSDIQTPLPNHFRIVGDTYVNKKKMDRLHNTWLKYTAARLVNYVIEGDPKSVLLYGEGRDEEYLPVVSRGKRIRVDFDTVVIKKCFMRAMVILKEKVQQADAETDPLQARENTYAIRIKDSLVEEWNKRFEEENIQPISADELVEVIGQVFSQIIQRYPTLKPN